MSEELYNIGHVAKELGRVPHTVRQWYRTGRVPEHLEPIRTERGWRVWTQEQIDGLKQWLIDEDMTSGKAFRRR